MPQPHTEMKSMFPWRELFVLAIWQAKFGLGAIYESPLDLPSQEFDFVVVGGGTAGSVVANRLTENTNYSVLVIEAGGSNIGAVDTTVPFFCMLSLPYDWNFTTTPQAGLNGQATGFPRGRILGGSSSINGMLYTRTSSDDFDRYARVTNDSGWSWESLQPYIFKNENFTLPADSSKFDPSVHGFSGVNTVSLADYPQSIDHRVIQTTVELPEEFPFNLDMNSGNPLGVGWQQVTIKEGQRSSAATSYLGPGYINRNNLHVLLNSQVTRILQTGSSDSLTFTSVEFAQSVEGPRVTVTAIKEVVLSAGTVGTPTILLNSGIGDEAELAAIGINSTLHLPDVGKNLTDQPRVENFWHVNGSDTWDPIMQNVTLRAELFLQWNQTHQGPLADTFAGQIAFLRLPDNASIFQQVEDPSAGPHAPHFELAISNGYTFSSVAPTEGNYIDFSTIVVSVGSRGTVKLNSSDPFDPPLIDPGYYTNPFDLFAMREAIKSSMRFLSAPVWQGYVLAPLDPRLAGATTDALLDDYIRNQTGTSAHPVGTASMSAYDADYGVVNPDLKLKNASGLRIVDASILPFVPSGHTQAPVYTVAERASSLIRAAWD